MINELYILQKLGLGDFLFFKNYIYKFMFLLWKTEFDNASRTSYTTDVSVSKNRFAHCCNMYLYMKNSMRIACGTQNAATYLQIALSIILIFFPKYVTTVFPNSSLFTQLHTISDKL